MKNEGAAWQSRSSDEGLISLDNATLDFLDARDDEEPIPDEVRWREPNATRGFARCDVRVSRWSASSGVEHERNDAKCGFACHTIVQKRGYIFTEYGHR